MTRAGTKCKALAVTGKERCRMHGGAKGSGVPHGNQNALKHGMYTREAKDLQKHVSKLLRDGKELVEKF